MVNLNSILQMKFGFNEVNMKKVFLIAIFLLASVTWGKANLIFKEKTQNFLRNQGQINDLLLKNKKIVIPQKGYSYVVSVDEKSQKTYNTLKNHFFKEFDVYEIKDKILKIKNENVKLDLSDLNSHRTLCAHKILKKIMPEGYADQFMLVSVDTQQSFSKKQGVRIEGYRFNFCRLFNGRVVRSKSDFLTIRTDASGLLKDARIAMQDLSLTSDVVKTDESYNENKIALDSVLNANTINALTEGGETVDEIEIRSATEAYCEIFVENSKKFFPCLSYVSKIKSSDDKEYGYIIDAPHSLKSWSDFNEKKNGSVRFVRYSR